MNMKRKNISRRNFMNKAGLATLGTGFLASSVFSIKSIANALHSSSRSGREGYKAMVCLLLEGGADSYNMLIPSGNPEYNEYAVSRSNLAISQNELLAINPLNNDGKLYGLHPAMSQIQSIPSLPGCGESG